MLFFFDAFFVEGAKNKPVPTRQWTCKKILVSIALVCRPLGRAVTRSSLEWEVWGSNLGPIKLDTVLPAARYRCDVSSKGAVLPGRNDATEGPANSFHASA